MNMMQMVAIMAACYFITLILLCVYRNIINIKIANAVFIIVDLIFFLGWNYAAYLRGWLDDGFMTLENISPFIMTLIPFTCLLNEKIRKYCDSAIAFLWVGMFLALLLSPQHAYIFSYYIEATPIYASEAACHLIASLYGVYLIISGQVKCNFKSWARSIICMYSVIGFGVILNYIFHTKNFGMDPYGDFTIYMVDILGSFWATLLAYLLGVMVVLSLGMQFGYLLNKLVDSTHITPRLTAVINGGSTTNVISEIECESNESDVNTEKNNAQDYENGENSDEFNDEICESCAEAQESEISGKCINDVMEEDGKNEL